MRNLFRTILVIIALQSTHSTEAQDCVNPLTQAAFQIQFNQVAVIPSNDAKLTKATAFLNNTCMLSSQVKLMSQLFTEDVPRLNYCTAAYSHTFDQANFYEVYDAFSKFSMALHLHDNVRSYNEKGHDHGSGNNNNTEVIFPNLTYPSSDNYKGRKGCAGPVIAAEIFKTISQNVFKQPTDESKYVTIQAAAEQYCLSFGMIMKITSLMQQESFRHKALVNTFYLIYDEESYEFGKMLLPTEVLRNDWLAYAKSFLTPPPPVCKVTDAEFKGIMKDFQNLHFSDERMSHFKTISKDRCYNVEQIKTISKEFPFSEEKMTVFKDSYAKCTDKNNYARLVDELSFSTEKDELRNFIKNN